MEADLAASTALDMADVCRSGDLGGLLLYALGRERRRWKSGNWRLVCLRGGFVGEVAQSGERLVGFRCLSFAGGRISVSNLFILSIRVYSPVPEPLFKRKFLKRWYCCPTLFRPMYLGSACPANPASGQITKSEIFPEELLT